MSGNRLQPFDLSGPKAGGDEVVLGPADRLDAGSVSAPAAATPAPAASGDVPPLEPATRNALAPAREPSGLPVYLGAAALTLASVGAPLAYVLASPGRFAALERTPGVLVELSLLAAAAIGFVWVAAFLAQQGRRLAADAGQARVLAESLLAPAALAARETGATVAVVRAEIERATAAAADAQAGLSALREALARDSASLAAAAQDSTRAANALTEGLASESRRLEALAAALEARAKSVAEAITAQARMVGEASDLAETQIREAEAALAARAADLAAAAGDAGNAARLAGDTLSGQLLRLETVNASTGEQARAIEESMAEQRAALVAASQAMRADHETYAAEAESQRAQLVAISGQARESARELSQTAGQSAEVLHQMVAATGEQLRALTNAAAEERDKLTAEAAQSVSAIAEIAGREREALEAKARAARGLLTGATSESQEKAQAAFEARMGEARQMIDQSTALIDEAGSRINARLTAGAEDTRQALVALQAVLAEVDQRLARAPADAEAQTTAIRQNVERGIEALMQSARQAAEETRSIDAAFQERVRRNYDMLSEAVRLMGVVAAAGSSGDRARARPAAPAPGDAAPPATAASPPPRVAPPLPVQPPAPRPAPDTPAVDAGARPRLKLTPTATDAEFKEVFDAAGGREPAETIGDSWTWKELLTSMDKPDDDDASVTAAILGEIEAMGIDAGALVPRGRVDEIIALQRGGDAAGGRDIVRRLAPAAVRRLARRLMTDPNFRAQAEQYVRRYAAVLNESAAHEGGDATAAGLLGSDQGRAYLLLDAAIIDAR
jgi:hypothetical protein